MKKRVWHSRGFLGVRVGRFYFKFRDLRVAPLLYTERNGYGYRTLLRIGNREIGVKS